MFRPKETGASAGGEDAHEKMEKRKPLFTKTHRVGSDGGARLAEETEADERAAGGHSWKSAANRSRERRIVITQARLESLEKKVDLAFKAIGVDDSVVEMRKEGPALMTGKENPLSITKEENAFKLDEE